MADIKVEAKYVKVTNADGSVAVSNYFNKARIETNQTIQQADIITGITASGLSELPETGWIEKDKLYNYQGTVVHCIQGHQRTAFQPSETPALFAVFRTNSDTLEWIENEKVCVGWKRVYNGNTYEVIQAHMTQNSWNPSLTLGTLWRVIATTNEWTVGVAYKVGDIVTYLGLTYKCLQAHTSQAGWTPPAVPALWKLV